LDPRTKEQRRVKLGEITHGTFLGDEEDGRVWRLASKFTGRYGGASVQEDAVRRSFNTRTPAGGGDSRVTSDGYQGLCFNTRTGALPRRRDLARSRRTDPFAS
jgi:hypothetical protein